MKVKCVVRSTTKEVSRGGEQQTARVDLWRHDYLGVCNVMKVVRTKCILWCVDRVNCGGMKK